MMKYKYLILAIVVGALFYIPFHSAAAETDRLEQWIAPLECVENEIVDGVNTITYLTPEECDELLNPAAPVGEEKPDNVPTKLPWAPDTGYSETVLTALLVIAATLFIALLRTIRIRKP